MKPASIAFALSSLAWPAVAYAQPEGPTPEPEPVASADVAPEPDPKTSAAGGRDSGITDAAWSALEGKHVVIETPQGPRQGELASASGDEIVLIGEDGRPISVPKRDASDVRVAPAPSGPTEPPASGPMPTTPPPSSSPTEAQDEELDPKEARKQRRQERRDKREHALLGLMTAHGGAYAHWRGDGVSAGGGAYTMDWGVGVNPSPKFGMYAVGGGVLGAKIDSRTTRANYGRLAFMFAFGGKWYFSMFGAGVGFNRLRFPDDTLQKDVGLSLPFKIFGKVPLPKKLYIGIGLAYDLGLVRGFSRYVNAIGGQIVFGRW